MTATLPNATDGGGTLFRARPVLLVAESGEAVAVDSSANGFVTIDAVHRQIHLGHVFEAGYYASSVADAANLDILFVTGAGHPHLKAQLAVGGNCVSYLYEGVTASNNGSAISAYNRNRNSLTSAETGIYNGPTITNTGILLSTSLVPGGSAGGHRTIGSTLGTFEEWILKPSTKYLLRTTNAAGSAIAISANIAFYEVD